MKKIQFAIFALLSLFVLNVNAQEVDPNFYIYLCYGQSNMEGRAKVEDVDLKNVPDAFKMMACVNYYYSSKKMYEWYEAVPPLVRENMGLSPADWFGRTMCDNLPGKRIGVVAVAVGAASVTHLDKDYDPSTIVDEVYWFKELMAPYNNMPYARLLACAKEAQKVGVIKGILLHHGEADNSQDYWAEGVHKIYTDLLEDLGLQAEDVPLFAGEVVRTEMGGIYGEHNETVMPDLPNVIPTAHIVSAEDLDHQGDGVHFSSKSTRIFGSRYAVEALKLMGIDEPIINLPEPSTTSLDNISLEDSDFVDVYNLQGMKLLNSAPKEALSMLSKGLYIVNGKKMFIRD